MQIKSPITGKDDTSLIREISVSKIVGLYQEQLHIDVARFFIGFDQIRLMKCDSTGYRFYHPLNIFGDDRFYQELQELEGYYSKEKWEYGVASSLITDNSAVLEVGSGGGQFLQKLSKKNGMKLCGLELNSDAVSESVKKGLPVVNSTIEEFASSNLAAHDVVCALQVLEHIPDIRSFIDSCLRALKAGGKLILCVPNNNPYLYKHDFFHTLNMPPHHAGLWNRAAFSRLPGFFPMRLKNIHIEALTDYKIWYQAQVNFLKGDRNPLYRLLSIVPRPLYKGTLMALRHLIEGRNILAEFIKT